MLKNKKLITGIILLLLILTNVLAARAQGGVPCDGDDPDATCPLDNWLPVLVIATAIFFGVYLYRRKTMLGGYKPEDDRVF
jgi:hypothetical protein